MDRYKNRIVVFAFCLLLFMTGCRSSDEAVISVEPAADQYDQIDTADSSHSVIQKQNTTLKNTMLYKNAPGTFLQEERVLTYTDAGAVYMNFYRMQGNYGYSVAFDIEKFCFELDESVDRIYINGSNRPDASDAVLYISENAEYALEELADKIVLECKQECNVEEVTIGEEEYPATWITYQENTERGTRKTDYYLIGYENRVLEIQLICSEEMDQSYYEQLQIILSTIRLDSIAEG